MVLARHTRSHRDHREKGPGEIEIEKRWRQVLLEGASAEDFQQAYDELHAEFLRTASGGEQEIYAEVNPRSPTEDRVRAVILQYTRELAETAGRGLDVLEIGTGDGRTAALLAAQGNQALSIDVSQVALEQARARWLRDPNPRLRYEFGDARAMDLPDASFDVIVSENLVEHISLEDMRQHLLLVRRLLVLRGAYLLYTPSRLWSGRGSAGFHLHVYTLRELSATLRECGFEPVWLEPRLHHRLGKLVPISVIGLILAGLWESTLRALRVQRWPVSLKSRVIPGIMVCAISKQL